MNYALGLVLLAIGSLLIFIGRADRDGNSPRFLRFGPAVVTYPPLVLVFIAFGVVALLSPHL